MTEVLCGLRFKFDEKLQKTVSFEYGAPEIKELIIINGGIIVDNPRACDYFLTESKNKYNCSKLSHVNFITIQVNYS